MLKKSEGLCPSFFQNTQFENLNPSKNFFFLLLHILSTFSLEINRNLTNLVKTEFQKFSKTRNCSETICQYVKGIKHHCWKQKVFWSNLSLGWMRWISPTLTWTKNLLRIVQNLTTCLQCAFWRQENEILRRSKRRWKIQNLYFLTDR